MADLPLEEQHAFSSFHDWFLARQWMLALPPDRQQAWLDAAEAGSPAGLRFRGICKLFAILGFALDETGGTEDHRLAAEAGDAAAQERTGHANYYGIYIDENPAEGFAWYRRAAAQGRRASAVHLASHDNPDRAEQADALAKVRAWAREGFAPAQFFLGHWCLRGHDGAPDVVQAVAWFRKAAEQGMAMAQMQMGSAYATGKGVEANPAQSDHWYRKASEMGSFAAQYAFAERLTKRGAPEDLVEAAKWYRASGELGYPHAMMKLAVALRKGSGVAVDAQEASLWLGRAASTGYAPARKLHEKWQRDGYGTTGSALAPGSVPEDAETVMDRARDHLNAPGGDLSEAARLVKQAADQGSPQAQYRLAVMHLRGEGVERSAPMAAVLARKSAEQGNPAGLSLYGLMLDLGCGVTRNRSEAVSWLRRAHAHGGTTAGKRLALIQREQTTWWLLVGGVGVMSLGALACLSHLMAVLLIVVGVVVLLTWNTKGAKTLTDAEMAEAVRVPEFSTLDAPGSGPTGLGQGPGGGRR